MNEGVLTQFEPATSVEPQPTADEDLKILIQKLDELGGKAGNKALREALGWNSTPERYWAARGRAIDMGQLATGRGKGGSVRLATLEPEESINDVTPTLQRPEYSRESDLYPGAMRTIETGWVKEANYDAYLIETTATKGSADTGGKWSRPDVAVLAMKSFPYLPHRIFDIITFEIKPRNHITVEGVFEALSHQQFASRAYVIFHLPEDAIPNSFADVSNSGRIISIAQKHGVGVIVAQDIADYDTWETVVPAARNQFDPEQANQFIAKSFSESSREQFIKWHK